MFIQISLTSFLLAVLITHHFWSFGGIFSFLFGAFLAPFPNPPPTPATSIHKRTRAVVRGNGTGALTRSSRFSSRNGAFVEHARRVVGETRGITRKS